MRKKYDISALQSKEISRKFSQKVCELVNSKWNDDLNGSDMWDVIRDGIKEAAHAESSRMGEEEATWLVPTQPQISGRVDCKAKQAL